MAKTNTLQRYLVVIFAIAGLGIMTYLTYIHYANRQSFCDISENVSCDVVTTSIYSEIFGVPMSVLGAGYFLLVLALMFWKRGSKIYQTIFLVTLFALLPSLYLSALELFVIESLCILCETSKLLMIAILIASYYGARSQEKITMRLIAPIFIAGLIAIAVTYFAQTGNAVKTDYSDFVGCLNEKGVVYYKSFRCNSCKRQEKLLGDAYTKLNSVECHPEGPNGNPELCLLKRISKTPTFLIEESGREMKRLEGLQPLKDLADFAGCEFQE